MFDADSFSTTTCQGYVWDNVQSDKVKQNIWPRVHMVCHRFWNIVKQITWCHFKVQLVFFISLQHRKCILIVLFIYIIMVSIEMFFISSMTPIQHQLQSYLMGTSHDLSHLMIYHPPRLHLPSWCRCPLTPLTSWWLRHTALQSFSFIEVLNRTMPSAWRGLFQQAMLSLIIDKHDVLYVECIQPLSTHMVLLVMSLCFHMFRFISVHQTKQMSIVYV